MDDSALIAVGLPVALAIIMFGLGLSLTVGDFARVARSPRAVVVCLVLQVLVLSGYLRDVGLVTGLFCLASLGIGYGACRLARLARPQAIAGATEVGVHNTTLALTIALSVLSSTEVAVPAAVYSVLMYPLATAFGLVVRRSTDLSVAQRPMGP